MSSRHAPAWIPLLVVGALAGCASGGASSSEDPLGIDRQEPEQGRFLLSDIRQLTYRGRRSSEGYFSADGSKLVFQSERDPKNPFYQMYVLDLTNGEAERISPGLGQTTCGWFHPSGDRVLFASTHLDREVVEEQEEEWEERSEGKIGRFVFDYDPDFEIYVADLSSDGREVSRLTHARGYDAEASWSPDGEWIVFASNRAAYSSPLVEEEEERLDYDPAYFVDLYLMRSDGSAVRRLTDEPGYDGGPVFSPDGEQIVWRRFSADGSAAEVHTMAVHGAEVRQLTDLDRYSWAPFYHPSGEYLVFSSGNGEPGDYELYIMDSDGRDDPVRVTQAGGYDGQAVFSPDGRRLAWTGRHSPETLSQIFIADWNDVEARRRLGLGRGGVMPVAGPVRVVGEEPPPEATGEEPFDPGGIEDPTLKRGGYTTRHMFALSRGLSRSTLRPVLRTPLFLVTIPVDIILLPATAIAGFFG